MYWKQEAPTPAIQILEFYLHPTGDHCVRVGLLSEQGYISIPFRLANTQCQNRSETIEQGLGSALNCSGMTRSHFVPVAASAKRLP